MPLLLLHNPRCSKSRAALALVEESGRPFQVREYLREPLSLDELRILKQKLGLSPSQWLRWGQDEASGLAKDAPERELLEAMAEYPILIERPILITEDAAAVGRPGPEALRPLLS